MEARGEALDWAIALAKAPAERVSLRQRSLPQGLHQLLQVAAASSESSLVELAASVGESAENLQEAARFYVREILFYQGADAYRVLGVSREVDLDTLRTHHRLLQQWLHPDRQTSDWDAIFAARVNAAWTHLRTDKSRQAYDSANPPRDFVAPTPARTAIWQSGEILSDEQDEGRWRRRMPAIALFGVCAVLGVLAVQDMQRKPDVLLVGDAAISEADVGALVKSVQKSGDRSVIRAMTAPETARVPQDRVAVAAMDARQIPEAISDSAATSPTPPSLPSRSSPAAVSVLTELALEHAGSKIAEQKTPVIDNNLGVASMPPLQRSEVAGAPSSRGPGPKTSSAVNVGKAVNEANDATAVKSAATDARLAASVAQKPALMPDRAQRAVANPTSVTQPVVEVRRSPLEASVSTERVRSAQKVGARLLAFMSTHELSPPPIWGSLTTQRGALELRKDLQTKGIPNFSAPNWRVGENVAAMQSSLRYPDGGAGRLTADLLWRERWLVTGLSFERDL